MNMPVFPIHDAHAAVDAELVASIAEVHQKFGLHHGALKLLQLSLWLDADNLTTLRLTAKSQFMVGEFEASLATLQRIERHKASDGLSDYETLMMASALAFRGERDQAQHLLGITQ